MHENYAMEEESIYGFLYKSNNLYKMEWND